MENKNVNCGCLSTKCVRHGNCKECIEHHSDGKKLPFCKRPENIGLDKKKDSLEHIIC